MRADALKNYDHVLATAREVIKDHGADASLRDIARRAGVGFATLYRHFPTREALLDALLRTHLDELTRLADTLEANSAADHALIAWSRAAVAFTHNFRGAVNLMSDALEDHDSALHTSCSRVQAAGARLLQRAQAAGRARRDIDGHDLLALIASIGWLHDQATFSERADRLFDVIWGALLIGKQ
jgi:AcrR family transcriptional regulator